MRQTTVRKGLYWLSASILLVSLLTFCYEDLASLLHLTTHGKSLLIFWGFFVVGTVGCFSIILVINGILQSSKVERRVPLLPALMLFILSVALFCFMLYWSMNDVTPPQLRPGETITI